MDNNNAIMEEPIKEDLDMNNIPEIKLGIVAVSRDCFPIALSEKRRAAIKAAYKGDLYEIGRAHV